MNNKIVFDLRDVLLRLHWFDFILQVGLGREQNDENKIDLLVGYGEEDTERYPSQIKTSLKDQWLDAKLSISDDAVRFDLGTSSGGVAVCDSTKLVGQIKEWIGGKNLAGQHRPWAIGYWLPEALCGDLATAKVLHDAKATYAEIKNLVVPYPEPLSRAIITLCIDEVRQKMDKLSRTFEKDGTIESVFCLSDIGVAMVRLAFARSRRYLRGFSSLAGQAVFLRSSDFTLYKLVFNLLRERGATHILEEIRRQL